LPSCKIHNSLAPSGGNTAASEETKMKKHDAITGFRLATKMATAASVTTMVMATTFATLAMPGIAMAAEASPVGLWKTIDDETGKPKSLIRITENDGELAGKIEKLFRTPDQDQNPKCEKCSGALKDQPIIGMTILSGLKKDGDGYSGGQIIDPANGKTYKSKLTVAEDGKKLNMRGYIGMPMLGRTQIWLRED
jgi:uncharacterized protein (DUF2147 family)